MFSSAGNRYLGDPSYDPFFEELERRKAIAFIHPTTIPPGADATGLTIPYGVAEFTFDTTRAITNMLYSGTLERYPLDPLHRVSRRRHHPVPGLAHRRCVISAGTAGPCAEADGLALLQKLYYDTALSTSDFVFGALKEFVPTSQVLFGSDFPYVTPAVLAAEKYGIENSKVLDDEDRVAIDRTNALQLFPKFANTPAVTR